MSGTAYHELSVHGTNGRARSAALAVAHELTRDTEPAALFTYRSSGRIAVVGTGPTAVTTAQFLAGAGLRCVLISTEPSEHTAVDRLHTLQARVESLRGYLGAFELTLAGAGEAGLSAVLGARWRTVDLVLDLAPEPLLRSEWTPPGYIRPDVDGLDAAIDKLTALVGEFDKPRFFQLDPSRCAHSRAGITACSRCLDACPADAIRAGGDSIEVDPGLCQGGGVCATACPSGAINYAYPRRSETQNTLAALLKSYAGSGGNNPTILFHDAELGRARVDDAAASLPENVLPFQLLEIGSLGLDSTLGVLARGAAVAVLIPQETPASVCEVLYEQLDIANRILENLGYDRPSLAVLNAVAPNGGPSEIETLSGPLVPPAGYAVQNDKRTALFLAAEHLHKHAPKPRPWVGLGAGAPTGEVTVDQDRCTLCMACVAQCPGKALVRGSDPPTLRFIEQNCVQCSLCARSCPEQAITASPRLLFDPVARRQQRTLKEEEPFRCISCGKAFTTQSMIARIRTQVGTHAMFSGAAARRLEMCENCRAIDIMTSSTDRLQGGSDARKP